MNPNLKQHPGDFIVQEIPLYTPADQGDHIFFEIKKTGIPTFDAIKRIASALGVHPRDIGYAGLKDAQAVTTQILSVEHKTPEQILALQIPNLQILSARRHGNKLRMGHLKGNHFILKVRDLVSEALPSIAQKLAQLEKTGLPNYFGEQRFGRRANNAALGAALLAHDDDALLAEFLGHPTDADDAQSIGARKAYDRNDLQTAMRLYPRHCGMERRILHKLLKTNPSSAVRAIDEPLKKLWVSALQSELFNKVLDKRIELDCLCKLLPGDLAVKHANGACFSVEDPALEQHRVDAFEISPTGPLIGYRITFPTGQSLEIEQTIMHEMGLAPEMFRDDVRLKIKGARRPLRVQPQNTAVESGTDEHGFFIQISFSLPPGSFATVLMDQIL